MFKKAILLVAASITWFVSEPTISQAQTLTMSGAVSGRVYNRTHNPMRYVTRGQFKFTIVATKYTYKNGVLRITDGQIHMNGPVSAVFYGAYGSFSSTGGSVSSRQTSFRNGMVNQLTISTSNLAPTLRIRGWNVAMNEYVAPR